jgi:hypothetical protein
MPKELDLQSDVSDEGSYCHFALVTRVAVVPADAKQPISNHRVREENSTEI